MKRVQSIKLKGYSTKNTPEAFGMDRGYICQDGNFHWNELFDMSPFLESTKQQQKPHTHTKKLLGHKDNINCRLSSILLNDDDGWPCAWNPHKN